MSLSLKKKEREGFNTDVITFSGKFSQAGICSTLIENIRSTMHASFLHDVSLSLSLSPNILGLHERNSEATQN